uniref:Putative secreted peptide n=1 Tax=Anopheles braziliensis TaxID=58242 RepID=A0A2M3ZT97_9DIPT
MRGPRRFGPIFASQIWRLLTLVRYAATQYGKLGSPEHRFVDEFRMHRVNRPEAQFTAGSREHGITKRRV